MTQVDRLGQIGRRGEDDLAGAGEVPPPANRRSPARRRRPRPACPPARTRVRRRARPGRARGCAGRRPSRSSLEASGSLLARWRGQRQVTVRGSVSMDGRVRPGKERVPSAGTPSTWPGGRRRAVGGRCRRPSGPKFQRVERRPPFGVCGAPVLQRRVVQLRTRSARRSAAAGAQEERERPAHQPPPPLRTCSCWVSMYGGAIAALTVPTMATDYERVSGTTRWVGATSGAATPRAARRRSGP